MPSLRQDRIRHRRTRDRRFHNRAPVPLQGVRRVVGRSQERAWKDETMNVRIDYCIHCGSKNIQEARRSPREITFRCLHCWKTFTHATACATRMAMNGGNDDAA